MKKDSKEPQFSISFPLEIFKGAAGYFSEVHAKHFESPGHFFFMSYLTCLGNLIASRVRLKSSLKTQPRFYTLLLGESASDRKSTAIDQTTDHFKKIFGDKFSYSMGVGSAEGLQKFFKSSPSYSLDEDDANQEKNPEKSYSMVLALDEFKAFVAKCKIRSSVLLECVNSLYEINRYENHTKNSSIILKNAHLSMLAASTIETYERIYDSNFISVGFPNRIFLVVGTAIAKHSIPPPIPKSKREKMIEDLRNINAFVGDGHTYAITKEAWDMYDAWYLNLDRTSIHSKRLDGYCLRAMMVLAVNLMSTLITKEIVEDAIRLCEWQFDVRRLHDPIDADNVIATLEQKIRRFLSTHGPLKDYILKQKTNANRTGLWIYGKAISNLRQAEEIDWDKDKKVYVLKKRA